MGNGLTKVGGRTQIGEVAAVTAAIPVAESDPPGSAGRAPGGVTQNHSEDWQVLETLGREGGENVDCVEIRGQLGF